MYGSSVKNPAGYVAIYESDYSTYHQNVSGKYVERITKWKYNEFTNPYWGYIRPLWTSPSLDLGSVFDATITDVHGKSMYRASDGSYNIKCVNDNKCLDCAGVGKENWTNIQVYKSNSTAAQKWYIYDVGNGRYVFEPQCAFGRVMDIGGKNWNCHLWEYGNNNANQRFVISKK